MEEFESFGFLVIRDIENLRSLLHKLHRGSNGAMWFTMGWVTA